MIKQIMYRVPILRTHVTCCRHYWRCRRLRSQM